MADEQHELNGSQKIAYTVRELLAELKTMVQTIDSKLDAKAEKSVVEAIDRRLLAIEESRKSEQVYATQLLADWRELLKEHSQVKLDINSLQTNKKDKEAFNVLWIPVIFNTFGILALVFFQVIVKVG